MRAVGNLFPVGQPFQARAVRVIGGRVVSLVSIVVWLDGVVLECGVV